jgi:hypothetical protein
MVLPQRSFSVRVKAANSAGLINLGAPPIDSSRASEFRRELGGAFQHAVTIDQQHERPT